jgi:excisionase family DNA binding protein
MSDTLRLMRSPLPGVIGIQAAADIEKLLYTREDSAFMLSISERSLDYLISSKEINTRRVGRRVLIPRSELLRFARGNHTDSIRPAKDEAA